MVNAIKISISMENGGGVKISIYDEISTLRAELEQKEKYLKELESKHFEPMGLWSVTTEGDCEGRTTKQLGEHVGNIFDIAKQLAGQSYYQLSFKRKSHITKHEHEKKKISNVYFNVQDESVRIFDQDQQINKLMPNLPEGHKLTKGNYYGSLLLEW